MVASGALIALSIQSKRETIEEQKAQIVALHQKQVENIRKTLELAAELKNAKSEEALHNRVLSQANSVLSPDQINTFTKSLQQMRDMQKFGMEMGKKMFAPKK